MTDTRQLTGFDALVELGRSGKVRQTKGPDGLIYYGVADFLIHFAPEGKVLRKWWYDERNRLIEKDPELAQILCHLKMAASDGKLYKTEAAPLWACFYIALMLDTPKAIQFKKALAFSMAQSVEQVKYRAMNVANDLEWAADSIHQHLLDRGALSDPDYHKPDTWADLIPHEVE